MQLVNRSRTQLKNIHSSVWEHPADKAALKTLSAMPGMDTVIKTLISATTGKSIRLITLASSVRTSERQFARLHGLFAETCRIFDMAEVPELYVSQNPFFNAGALGLDRPFVVLNSGLVEKTDEDELIHIMGHELGHILSGHTLYRTVLMMLLRLNELTASIPLSGMALGAIIAGLREWERKSELSCDRAGLLACQNADESIHTLMKIAGGSNINEMNLGEFLKQAEEYQNSNSALDTTFKLLNTVFASHPYPVVRVLELLNWVRSGEYDNILRGFYDKGKRTYTEDVKEAANSYKEEIKSTVNPVIKDVSEGINTATQKAKDIFGNLF